MNKKLTSTQKKANAMMERERKALEARQKTRGRSASKTKDPTRRHNSY